MTPLEQISSALRQADAGHPDLKVINTNASAAQLLGFALAIAGSDWYFVGKSTGNSMDGAGVRPVWFQTQAVPCVRPDGQTQVVTIDAVSQDAAWHLPTRQQFKVIANSAANEPGDWEHGPARLTPYLIDPVNYRWHNPPIAQPAGVAHPPTPTPPPAHMELPDRGEMMRAGQELHFFYRAPEGLQRPDGLWKPETPTSIAQPDWEGIGAWLFDVYLKARIAGKDATEAMAEVKAQIRSSDEWKGKHP